MEIKSLTESSFDKIYTAFSDAFSDYDIQVNRDELEAMTKRRGFSADASFAAFENDRIVAFTLNGIGMFKGKKTAYDTGTGTIREYRGQGLAAQIFEYSLPHLKEIGVQNYLLEVLQHNTTAFNIYQKMGFQVSREFNYFKQENDKVEVKKLKNDNIQLRSAELAELEKLERFFDFDPSWQNSFDSIKRDKSNFIITGAYESNVLIGLSVFEPKSGDLTQIAVSPEHRRKGIGSLLLSKILTENKNTILKIVNTETTCDSITAFLRANKIEITGKQFEMIREV